MGSLVLLRPGPGSVDALPGFGIGEETFAGFGHLSQSASGFLVLFVLAKKLFADKEHSYTKAIAGDVLVMAVAGADLLAILNGIAA